MPSASRARSGEKVGRESTVADDIQKDLFFVKPWSQALCHILMSDDSKARSQQQIHSVTIMAAYKRRKKVKVKY